MSASETAFTRSTAANLPEGALPASRKDLVNLADVPVAAWTALAARALEPNPFYDPAWARPAASVARVLRAPQALVAYEQGAGGNLIGLLPVVSAWRAWRLPIPVLVAWQGYAPLSTPLLDGACGTQAAGRLLDAAAAVGARALVLPFCVEDGPVYAAFASALAARGHGPQILRRHVRAAYDATADAESELRAALGAKKLKELRRQFHRLEDTGTVTFEVATTPQSVAHALDAFLKLEAQGWKGRRGTALGQHEGDATFLRAAAVALAEQGRCEVAMLVRNKDVVLAAGILLRHGTRSFFFKLAYEESEARLSPGVQLTLAITRHLGADARVRDVDSTADAEHPMIDHIWRGRLPVAEVFMPTGRARATPSRWLIEARAALREPVRRLVHRLRDQEKRR